jgi:flavin-dependent thymidylate synthase
MQDRLATLSGSSVEWHHPEKLFAYDFDGDMIRVESGMVDLLVTPNHKMHVCYTSTKKGRKKEQSSYQLVPAEQLLNYSHAYQKDGPVAGKATDALHKFIGFAAGDGSCRGKTVDFHLRKPRKISYLKWLCTELGWDYVNDVNAECFRVYVDLNMLDPEEFYTQTRAKQIPFTFMQNLTPDLAASLLDGLINSDGSIDANNYTSFSTTSEKLANQVQAIAMLAGRAANIQHNGNSCERTQSYGTARMFSMSIISRNLRPHINKLAYQRGNEVKKERYTGKVYCATVPNHVMYVRRRGKAVWSGNSVLEHVTFTFAIEGITRVLTGELNRHRAGVAISEGSGRYIRFNDDIAYRLPTVFRHREGDDWPLMDKREESANVMAEAFATQAGYYAKLERIWADELAGTDFHTKKELTSAMRRIIGIGYCTGGVWTFNARALRHVICLRSAEGAEEEIRELAKLLYQVAEPMSPLLFADMHLNDNGVIETEYPKI